MVTAVSGIAAAQSSLADSLRNACIGMQSVECDFTQTRHVPMMDEDVVSHGRMAYVKPDYFKWEYTDPEIFVIEMNDSDLSVTKTKEDGTEEVTSSKMYRDLARLLIGAVSGKLISDDKLFATEVSCDGKHVIARLIPKKPELKRMWIGMTMFFEPVTFKALHIDISENGGSTTAIDFKYNQ